MPDTRLLIGGAVALVVILVVWFLMRGRRKAEEQEPAPFVPPNPFDKPPQPKTPSAPGPVSTPVSGQVPSAAPPVQQSGETEAIPTPPVQAPPPAEAIRTPPVPTPAPAVAEAPAPMAPIEEPDAATLAAEPPPVSLDSDALDSVRAPEPEPAPPPPPKPAPPKAPPPAPRPARPISAGTPAAKPISERKPEPKPASSKETSPATPQAIAEPAKKPAPSKPDVPADAELDFSALRDKASEAKVSAEAAAAAPAAGAIAAKYAAPPNPETAELEKNDPRHAAARRLARLSVSEIKLYHETEVTEGRAKKDLWRRLQADIALATQTFDKRVDQEVRDRFDYLYDEILRQLADGDAERLGPEAPKPKVTAKEEEAPPREEPKAEAPTAEAPKPEEPKAPVESATTTVPAVTKRAVEPSHPETAELEKSDPRHAAARRLARLSVSEIKLYHEDEVKQGREKKDLWTRLQGDIALAKQTFDKRVDQEVRDRFDYLYDEILRQLAEGDADKLGPDAPKPKAKVEKAEKVEEPKPAVEEAKPAVAEAKPSEPKPTMPGVKYAPPSNPETAELEKSDPRHAAARRLARLSVSEIKLYHEDEVKEGRAKKDLYTRLGADIALAKQTFEKRVDQEVRDRFDYLYDEIVRQLAEGNDELLGPDAPPKPKKSVEAKPEPKAEEPPPPAPVSEPKVEAAAPAPVADAKTTQPSAAAKYAPPANPATAELEKSDPRHAAARRLARLSVSEIKLYHEDEVKQGREKKDLWTRLQGDIALAKQTFDKRVDQEVRDRFDYLYDEILRQLAEGDADKLGPDAPKPKDA